MSSGTELAAPNRHQRRRQAALERRARNPDTQVAWTIAHWGADTDLGKTTVSQLIATEEVESVKVGKRRLILTPPEVYLRGKLKRVGACAMGGNEPTRIERDAGEPGVSQSATEDTGCCSGRTSPTQDLGSWQPLGAAIARVVARIRPEDPPEQPR
jgi:hypothetical protein